MSAVIGLLFFFVALWMLYESRGVPEAGRKLTPPFVGESRSGGLDQRGAASKLEGGVSRRIEGGVQLPAPPVQEGPDQGARVEFAGRGHIAELSAEISAGFAEGSRFPHSEPSVRC